MFATKPRIMDDVVFTVKRKVGALQADPSSGGAPQHTPLTEDPMSSSGKAAATPAAPAPSVCANLGDGLEAG